jgi:hypothetical protein
MNYIAPEVEGRELRGKVLSQPKSLKVGQGPPYDSVEVFV